MKEVDTPPEAATEAASNHASPKGTSEKKDTPRKTCGMAPPVSAGVLCSSMTWDNGQLLTLALPDQGPPGHGNDFVITVASPKQTSERYTGDKVLNMSGRTTMR